MTLRQIPELQAFAGLGSAGRELHMRAAQMWSADVRAAGVADNNVISILEPIGEDFFGGGFTDKRMSAALRAIGERDVIVQINSPGGSYTQGVSMYNMLRSHPQKVTVQILGIAASAASIVAMAGDRIEIAKAGFVFVHNSEGVTAGNRHVHAETIEVLATFDEAAVAAYAARTGRPEKEIAKLLDAETLMSSASAIEKGFADALLPADKVKQTPAPVAESASALTKMDAALAHAGMSRKDRRHLFNAFKAGMPRAAEDVTPGADMMINQVLADLRAIDIPLS